MKTNASLLALSCVNDYLSFAEYSDTFSSFRVVERDIEQPYRIVVRILYAKHVLLPPICWSVRLSEQGGISNRFDETLQLDKPWPDEWKNFRCCGRKCKGRV